MLNGPAQAAGLDADAPEVRYLRPPRDLSFAFLAPFTRSLAQFDWARAALGLFAKESAAVSRLQGDVRWLRQIAEGQAQGAVSHCFCVMAADAPLAQQRARAGERL